MKKALLFVSVFIVGQLFVSSVGVAVFSLIQSLSGSTADGSDLLSDRYALSLLSLVADVVVLAIAYFLLRTYRKEPFLHCLRRWVGGRPLVLILVTSAVCMWAVNMVCEAIDIPDMLENQFLSLSHNFLGVLLMAVAGPFAEEYVFRYCIEGSLLRSKRWERHAVWISALLFGLVHFNPAQIFAAFLSGLFLGWLYRRTHSLWPPLLCHVLNNSMAVVQMQLLPPETTTRQLIGSDTAYQAVLIATVLMGTVLLIGLFRKLPREESFS